MTGRNAAMFVRALLATMGVLCAGIAIGTPVVDALDRPALAVAAPASAVLLGAARAGSRMVAVGEHGIVVVSDDAGRSWHQARVPVSSTLTAVRFADAREGWAVGHSGVVLHTSDGGATWTRQLDGVAAAGLVLDQARRRVAQAPPGSPLRASGERAVHEAERLVKEGAVKPFLDLAFADATRGIVVGAYGLAFGTSNGGRTWHPLTLDNPKALHLYAVRVQATTLLIAGEQGLLLRSDDGGDTFGRLESPYAGSWFTAEILPGGEFLVAGLRGNAFRSGDRGASWDRVVTPAPVSITASALRGARVMFANQAGALFFSSDAGRTLVPFAGPPLPSPAALLPLDDGVVWTFGPRGAIPARTAGSTSAPMFAEVSR